MSMAASLLMSGLIIFLTCAAVSGFSRRPASVWNYYYFDGRDFVAGRPADDAPYLAVRDGVKPVVVKRASTAAAEPLPDTAGALAGICFIQSSGGKMADGHGYLPCPGTNVEIFSGTMLVLSTRTDDSGYFVALLPAGRYRLTSGAFATETSVEAGTTILVPLRAGKRMVD